MPAPVAQGIEHRFPKPVVAGSNPAGGTEVCSLERTYGWAWLLKLAEELHGWDDPDGRAWAYNYSTSRSDLFLADGMR